MRPAYLDNNATTRVDPEVVAAMLPYFTDQFGNASSKHGFGTAVSGAVMEARRRLGALIGAARDQEIIFTSGGTESDNAAIRSALGSRSERNEVIISAVEHPAVLALCMHLEKSRGVRVFRIPVDSRGRLDIDTYQKSLSHRTALVSMMWANNETGTIFPVAALAELAHRAGALFHTDAVQAVGKIPIDVEAGNIDMLSLSGHKFHAPKGIGALYLRRSVPFSPLLRGGRQERGRRAGTENVPAIVALGKAAELAAQYLRREQTSIGELRDRFETRVLQQVSDCFVLGDRDNRLPNTSSIAFDRAESEVILSMLDNEQIAASSGSACSSGAMEPSHVLRAMNVAYTAAHGVIRFSLSRESGDEDVERVLAVLPGIVEKAREVSPFSQIADEQPARFAANLIRA